MSYIDINAYNCTCERCSHTWGAFKIPLTCAKCRSPYWNTPRGDTSVFEKKSAASPNLDIEEKPIKMLHPERTEEERKKDISSLMSLVDKENYKKKSILPPWPAKFVDQPDYYDSERSVKYD